MPPLSFENRYARSWHDLECAHWEHSDKVRELTVYYLGYQPDRLVYTQHIPFLANLVHLKLAGRMSEHDFRVACYEHMKLMRNDHIKKGPAVRSLPYSPDMLKQYETCLPQFKDQARRRLCRLIGFEPDLAHSLCAELMLRDLFESDSFYEDQPINNIDCEALDLVWYVFTFMEGGQGAADDQDLMLRPRPQLGKDA